MQAEKIGVKTSKKQVTGGALGEFVKVIIQAVLIALVVRTFLFQPFNIPSGSLIPSLLVGDYLFVSKYAYGYSKYSLPLSPNLFSGRLLSALPKRGDIAVFKYPVDNSSDYIKRVIGLPGETVTVEGEILSINGKKSTYKFVRECAPEGGGAQDNVAGCTPDLKGRRAYVYEETLPGGITHLMQTLDHKIDAPGPYFTTTVEPGTVFMMGDNRDDSADSRSWGALPQENLEGRAEVVFFSIKTVPGPQVGPEPETEPIWQFWRWPWTVRWNRLFTRIQ